MWTWEDYHREHVEPNGMAPGCRCAVCVHTRPLVPDPDAADPDRGSIADKAGLLDALDGQPAGGVFAEADAQTRAEEIDPKP